MGQETHTGYADCGESSAAVRARPKIHQETGSKTIAAFALIKHGTGGSWRLPRGLLSKVSAVDHEFAAGHEARLVGGKEKSTLSDFRPGASALHRRHPPDVGLHCRVLRLAHRCVLTSRLP